MPDFRNAPLANLALAIMLFAAMGMLIVIGVYVVSRFRGAAEEDGAMASELLTKFREMHSRGQLSDEEYRTIKAKLAVELRQELKDTDRPD